VDSTNAVNELDDAVNLTLDGVTVRACAAGIEYDAGDLDGRLSLHNAQIQSQADALRVSGSFSGVDLGVAATPGNNQLTTTSGPAFRDDRSTAGAAVDAHGTVLNGVSYSGDVLGPADVTGGYHIQAPNTIRF
jgi:hypothetical protein